ncbi:MAG: hypothetical protein OEM05_18875 [Myxococcales bacterium]|nr:hypothetical protein [Myxococcales bacterium]
MYEDTQVKYLFVALKYPAYVKLQVALVIGWLIGSILCFSWARESDVWLLKNGWWLCLAIGGLEVLESLVAIRKAKNA